MSKENRHFNVTVDGTLIGTKTYSVKIILTMHERWGTKAVPDEILVEREDLSAMPDMDVEDGNYVLRYSLDNKDFNLNRRVVGGKLIAA